MRIFTFSVRPDKDSDLKMVEKLKLYGIKTGTNFSFIVLAALREYIANHLELDD